MYNRAWLYQLIRLFIADKVTVFELLRAYRIVYGLEALRARC